jgi:hypothetical protein
MYDDSRMMAPGGLLLASTLADALSLGRRTGPRPAAGATNIHLL